MRLERNAAVGARVCLPSNDPQGIAAAIAAVAVERLALTNSKSYTYRTARPRANGPPLGRLRSPRELR